ncbi:hypothetical protein ABZ565_02595 [Streptomyces sp. NPDC016469]
MVLEILGLDLMSGTLRELPYAPSRMPFDDDESVRDKQRSEIEQHMVIGA